MDLLVSLDAVVKVCLHVLMICSAWMSDSVTPSMQGIVRSRGERLEAEGKVEGAGRDNVLFGVGLWTASVRCCCPDGACLELCGLTGLA